MKFKEKDGLVMDLRQLELIAKDRIVHSLKSKDVNIPDLGDWIDLSGCDLKDVNIPDLGDWLDLRGCDLKDVNIPDVGD